MSKLDDSLLFSVSLFVALSLIFMGPANAWLDYPCLKFDQTDDYIGFNGLAAEVTFEFWVQPDRTIEVASVCDCGSKSVLLISSGPTILGSGRVLELVRRNKVFRKIFPDLEYELERVLGRCKSKDCTLVLDLGCGSSSPLSFLSRSSHSVGLDVFQPSIENSMKEEIHKEYLLMDVRHIDGTFRPKSYDCVVALALIEHLEKDDGIRLIQMMETIARKEVVISTPNGFLSRKESQGNEWMEHKSGWTVEEMRKRGYTIVGLNGWKPLRGENNAVRYSPKMFWSLISRLTQLFVRNRPENAFTILCVKNLDRPISTARTTNKA